MPLVVSEVEGLGDGAGVVHEMIMGVTLGEPRVVCHFRYDRKSISSSPGRLLCGRRLGFQD